MKNTSFSKAHYKLLKKFYKANHLHISNIKNPNLIDGLLNNDFIYCINESHRYTSSTPSENRIYSITYAGCECVETHKRDTLHFYLSIGITNTISFAALIVSVIALLSK